MRIFHFTALLAALAWAAPVAADDGDGGDASPASAEAPVEDGESGLAFTVGFGVRFHRGIGVPDGDRAARVLAGGVEWRLRFTDWAQIGGGLFGGADVDDVGSDYTSIRFEALSAQFEVPAADWVHPYIRAGFGWQGESLRGNRPGEVARVGPDEGSDVHGANGFMGFAAPGILFMPVHWLDIHLEFQTTIAENGKPDGNDRDGENSDTGVEIGGVFGLGFIF